MFGPRCWGISVEKIKELGPKLQAHWAQFREISEIPELQKNGLLILDEYADEKSGGKSAGTARQYNGLIGKVDECQVAVALC